MRPRLFLFLCAFSPVIPSLVQADKAPENKKTGAPLTLVIKGLKDDTGLLLVAVYTDEKTWLGKNPALGGDMPVTRDADGTMTVVFGEKPPGPVAVAVIHDRNANQDMDRNMLGIPLEAYGFSRGVRPRFGAPSFKDARIDTDNPIEISLDTLL